jgi:hypothetical protein
MDEKRGHHRARHADALILVLLTAKSGDAVKHRRKETALKTLADGADIWRKYMDALQKKLPYMLEFMPDGLIETLPREANTLHSIIKNK